MSDMFDAAGSLREVYAAVDWSASSVGAPETWSTTLRAIAGFALHTKFAVTLLWGPDFTMIYNEAYVPIIGDKHPAALGAPAREVFPEIWDQIGPMMQAVRDGNGPVWMPDIRLLMDRHEFPEETFFHFCYSPAGQGGSQVRNYLRGFAYISDLTPAATLHNLDRAMQGLASGTFATAVVATVEQSEQQAAAGLRMLRWSNAGHPPPLLVSADGQTSFLQAQPEMMLGVAADVPRSDHCVLLEPGCTVLLYTDGLIERPGQDLDDGMAALADHLRHTQKMSAEDLCDHVLDRFGPSAEDDVALLVLHAYSEAEPRPAEAGPTVLPAGADSSPVP